jgi:hypothetical protein
MKISVKTLKGKHFDLYVSPSDTVRPSLLFFRVIKTERYSSLVFFKERLHFV